MGKRTKNYNKYNEDILNQLKLKFGFSIDYLRKCLRGDRTGVMPDTIKKEYNVLDNASKTAIEIKSNSLNQE